MDINQIKEMLASSEYDFLRTDPCLKDNILYLTLGGSHAYGTDVETSDIDVRGISWEGPNSILGLSNFEQFENKETDTTIYGLRKIVSLLLNCNPNVIEMLGTKEDHILHITDEGKMLRDNVNLFLSKKAVYSFGGYAIAQLRRLENALARDSYPQDKKEEHILKSIQSNMEHFRTHYEPFTDGAFNLYTDVSSKEEYETEIFMDINLKRYPLRDFKNIFSEMSETVKNYGKLNHRNKKKDEEHLNKHAMHLVRLYLMGIDILENGIVNTYRDTERNLLLDIRHGKYAYDEIFEMVNEYEKKFEYAEKNSMLPAKPDYNKVEELVMEINKRLLRKMSII